MQLYGDRRVGYSKKASSYLGSVLASIVVGIILLYPITVYFIDTSPIASSFAIAFGFMFLGIAFMNVLALMGSSVKHLLFS